MQRSGLFFIFSAPSGTGKTTITHRLLEKDRDLRLSISATTRLCRNGEVDGQSYYFFNDADFNDAVNQQAFVEHARVFEHQYGTLKAPLEQASAMGKDVVLDLDTQGARSMRAWYGKKAILIYVLPPNLRALATRLHDRGQDSPDHIRNRLAKAYEEIQNCIDYDYFIVNDDLNQSVDHAWAIIQGERCRCIHQREFKEFLADFSHSNQPLQP
jgi:guanylate kinase